MPDAEERASVKGDRALTELDLAKLFVPDISDDVVFPEELNCYLRDRVQYLTHENSRLEENLSDKEVKLQDSLSRIQNLSKQVQNYDNAASSSGFAYVSDVASGKIVDLSKKLREKSAEVEALKTKCSRLQQQIFNVQQKQQSEAAETVREVEKAPANQLEEQVKQLQEKLNSISNKLFDSRNVNVKLKNELKLAKKYVQQEIGDTLQNIANSGSNWRGRSQIIWDLHQKNSDLKEKLKACQNGKAVETITKSDRRLELLSRENSVLKSELHEVKRRLEGARARSKLTESECSVLRAKVMAVTEQQDNDRNLIAVMTSQLSHKKHTQQEHGKQKDHAIMQLERDYKTLQLELIEEKCRFENLQKELKERETEVQELKSGNGYRPEDTEHVNDRVVSRLEAERMKLLELTEISSKRLERERNSCVNLQLQLRAERQKTAKLEAKISYLQLERSDRASTYTLPSSRTKEPNASAEDRLTLTEETIKVLQNRLEVEQRERQMDFEEFAHILQNYKPNDTEPH